MPNGPRISMANDAPIQDDMTTSSTLHRCKVVHSVFLPQARAFRTLANMIIGSSYHGTLGNASFGRLFVVPLQIVGVSHSNVQKYSSQLQVSSGAGPRSKKACRRLSGTLYFSEDGGSHSLGVAKAIKQAKLRTTVLAATSPRKLHWTLY